MPVQARINDKIGYQLIKTFNCEKLSIRSKGKLEYQLWQNQNDQSFGLAMSKNESSGGFSAELIQVSDIIELLSQLKLTQQSFHATEFKSLFTGKSANNPSFLAAVLVDQQVIRMHPLVERLLNVDADYELWPIGLESHVKAPITPNLTLEQAKPDKGIKAAKKGQIKAVTNQQQSDDQSDEAPVEEVDHAVH